MSRRAPAIALTRTIPLTTLAATCTATMASATDYLPDPIKPRSSCPGMQRVTEVVMRSLVPRPANPDDSQDTLRARRDFHVTRGQWTHSPTPQFLAKVEAPGCTVSGAATNDSILGLHITV